MIEKEIDTSLSLTANLKAVFHESDFLGHSYKRVHIMLASKRFTIVPLDLFEEEQAELLFYHKPKKREKMCIRDSPITMGYRTVDIINYTHKLRNCY